MATAPFAVDAESQILVVIKHPTFSESVLPNVLTTLLNDGERQREDRDTEWAVEPLLDDAAFGEWLDGIAVLEQLRFDVKLPNPDSADAFDELVAHMNSQGAGEMVHVLKPRDPAQGLTKDIEGDTLGAGLMEMARRSFASVRALGRNKRGKRTEYNQKTKGLRERLTMPDTYEQAQRRLADLAREVRLGSDD